MNRKALWVLLISASLVLILLPFVAGGCTAPSTQTQEPIKIGALMDMTSFHTTDDAPTLEGIKLKFKQEDYQIDGRPIELTVRDYGSNPDMCLSAARDLIERNKVQLLIGPLDSGCAMAIASYLDTAKIPDIAQCNHPDEIALQHEWVWQTIGTLKMFTYPGGDFCANDRGYKTATTLGIDYVAGHEYVNSCVAGFVENGGTLIQQQWFPPDTLDFSSYLTALKPADVLIICAFGPTAIGVYTQVQQLGIKTPIFDVYQELDVPEKKEALGKTPIGNYGITTWVSSDDNPNEQSKEFIQAFNAEYGYIPPHFASLGYNAACIIIEALKNAKGDYSSDNLAKALNAVKTDTILGPQSFGAYRLARATNIITQVVPEGEYFTQRVVAHYIVEGEKVGDIIQPKIVKRY
jgi:branched-chain amino acid transport system substrate-binding protein